MGTVAPHRTNQQWLEALSAEGAARDAALEELRRLLVTGLRRGLMRRVRDNRGDFASQTEDFAQEALVRILGKLDTFRGESQFTTWAHKIAVRVALTELRRKRWRDVSLDTLTGDGEETRSLDLPDRAPGPAQISSKKAVLHRVRHYIEQDLSPKQRQAMLAVAIYGIPLDVVARQMGSTRNAMYKLLHDARKRLRQKMLQDGLTPERVLTLF